MYLSVTGQMLRCFSISFVHKLYRQEIIKHNSFSLFTAQTCTVGYCLAIVPPLQLKSVNELGIFFFVAWRALKGCGGPKSSSEVSTCVTPPA